MSGISYRPIPGSSPRRRRGFSISERRLLLVFGDAVAVTLAFLAAFHLRTAQIRGAGLAVPRIALAIVVVSWLACAQLVDAYRLVNTVDVRSVFRTVFAAIALSSVTLLAVFFAVPFRITRPTLLLWIPLATVLVLLWRTTYQRLFSRAIFAGNLVVIANPRSFERIWAEAEATLPNLYRVVAILDPEREDIASRLERIDDADLVVGTGEHVSEHLFDQLLRCHDRGLRIRSLTDLYEEMTGRLPIEQLGHSWLMSLPMRSQTSRGYAAFKRVVDIAAGGLGLAVLAAVFPWVALAIWLEDRGPIFYRQRRVGQYGTEFDIVKLRTMRVLAPEGEHQTGVDDPRVTRVGRVLRRIHLDELPQSINILRGEMSLVGPRPEQPTYVALMRREIEFYNTRLSVRPGLTGWAQVNYGYGEGVAGAREKLSYDLYYVEHQGFGLDVLIVARTLRAVFSFQGR